MLAKMMLRVLACLSILVASGVVHAQGPINQIPLGEPFYAFINQTSYFTFTAPDNAPVTLRVSPRWGGEFSSWSLSTGSSVVAPGTGMWNSDPWYNGEVFTIPSPGTSLFSLTVYNTSYFNSSVIIHVSQPSTNVRLWHFEALQARVLAGIPQFYYVNSSFPVYSSCPSTTVTITQLGGGPNSTYMYISNTGPVSPPPSGLTPVQDVAIGSYSVNLPNVVNSMVNIALYAYANSTVQILAYSPCIVPEPNNYDNSTFHIFLRNGLPQFSVLNQNSPNTSSQLYSFQPRNTSVSVLITLSMNYGNAIVYVATNNFGFPNASAYQWSNVVQGSNLILYIPLDDPRRCLDLNTCWYYARVVSTTPDQTAYSIVATYRHRPTMLQNGVSQASSVNTFYGDFSVFQLPVNSVTGPVKFEVLAYDSLVNNENLALQCGVSANLSTFFVNPNAQWAIDAFVVYRKFGIVYINPSDPIWCTPSQTSTCYYYLICYNNGTTNVSFEVTGTTGFFTRPLVNGVERWTAGLANVSYWYDTYSFLVSPGYNAVSFSFSDIIGGSSVKVVGLNAPGSTYLDYDDYGPVKTLTIQENNPQLACQLSNQQQYCEYLISVYPQVGMLFGNYSVALTSLVGATTNVSIRLSDGITYDGIVPLPLQISYFSIDVPELADSLQIVLSTRFGYVFVSNNSSTPSPGDPSVSFRADTLLGLAQINIPQPMGTYYIGVYASTVDLSFEIRCNILSIIRSSSQPTHLFKGKVVPQPMQREMISHDTRILYYDYIPESDDLWINIELNAEGGLPRFLVSYIPFNSTKQWPSPPDVNGDPNYPGVPADYSAPDPEWNQRFINVVDWTTLYGPGRFIVGVYAEAGTPASYSIVCNTFGTFSNSTYQLVGGRKAFGAVPPFMMRQYSIATNPLSTSVRIAMTSFYGDAEVFIGTQGSVNFTNFNWRGYDAGTSSILIDANSNPPFVPGATYYIAVYPHEEPAYYHLVASAYDLNATAILLKSGDALNWITPQQEYSRFVFLPESWDIDADTLIQPFSWTISPSLDFGSIRLFVNAYDRSQMSNISWPTRESHMWQGSQAVFIDNSDINFCRYGHIYGECIYLITVSTENGYNSTAQYTLLVTPVFNSSSYWGSWDSSLNPYVANTTWRLPNHIPQFRELLAAGNEEYWRFYVWPGVNVSDVYISMTPLSGYGIMMVTNSMITSTQPFIPDTSKNIFVDFINNTFTFTTTTAPWPQNQNGTIFYVTVRALPYSNLTYTIVAGQNPQSGRVGRFPTRLSSGIPLYDTISDYQISQWRYYVFYLPMQDTLAFSFPRRMRDMDIYIKYTPWMSNGNYYLVANSPNSTYFDLAITNHGLDAWHLTNASAGRYEIGIYATHRADYAISVTAFRTFTPTILIYDQPMTARIIPSWFSPIQAVVGFNSYKLYMHANTTRDLVLTLSTLSGHVVMYVANDPFIDPFNSSTYITASNNTRLEQIVLRPDQVKPVMFILVVTYVNSTYALSATHFTYQQLQTGLPFSAYINASDAHYYHITLPGGMQSHDAYISLSPQRGKAAIYVSNVTDGFVIPFANDSSTYIASANSYFTNSQLIRLQNSQCTLKRCTYIILVQARWWSNCRYNIVVQPVNDTAWNNGSSVLQATVPQYGYTPWNYSMYSTFIAPTSHYEFHVSDWNSTVTLAMTTFSGYPFMAISRYQYPVWNGSFPINNQTVTGAEFITERLTLSFDANHPLFSDGSTMASHWLVSVFSQYERSAYTLAVSTVSQSMKAQGVNATALILVGGQPQRSLVLPRTATELFELEMAQLLVDDFMPRPVTITLSNPSVDASIYVTSDGTIPSYDNYQASSKAGTNNIVYIPDIRQLCNISVQDCDYLITVNNSQANPNYFTMTASSGYGTDTAVSQLSSGISQFGYSPDGSPVYYTFEIENRFDNPTLYISLNPGAVPVEAFIASESFAFMNGLNSSMYQAKTVFNEGAITAQISNAQNGLYVIAVYPRGVPQSFDFYLTASLGYIMIGDGVSYLDEINATDTRLYSYLMTDDDPTSVFSVTITPLAEGGMVNVSVFILSFDGFVMIANSSYTSFAFIDIGPEDFGYRPNGQYFVWITGVAPKSSYSILMASGDVSEVLQDGVAAYNVRPLQPGQALYYRYDAYDSVRQTDLLISVTKRDGSVDMYVSALSRFPSNLTQNLGESGYRLGQSAYVNLNFSVVNATRAYSPYIYIGVVNNGNVTANFRITASLGPIQLYPGRPSLAVCTPGIPSAFYLPIASADQITFQIGERDQPLYIPFPTYVNYNNHSGFPNATNNVWNGLLTPWNNSNVQITKHDISLRNCLTNDENGCFIFVALDCSNYTSDVDFYFSADLGDKPIFLNVASYDRQEVFPGDSVYYAIYSDFPGIVNTEIEPCYGNAFAYMSDTNEFPSPTNAQAKSEKTNQVQQVNLGYLDNKTQNAYVFVSSVAQNFRGQNPIRDRVIFEVVADINHLQFARPILPGNPAITYSFPSTAGAVTLSFELASVPSFINDTLNYYVLYATGVDPDRVLYTLCGLFESSATLYANYSTAYLNQTVNSFGEAQITITGLDSNQVYSFSIVTAYANSGFYGRYFVALYTPTSRVQLSGGGNNDKEDTAAAVVLAFILPLTAILIAVAVYFYVRNRRLEQELSVELPDVGGSSRYKSRAQRGPDSRGTFTRGGQDYSSNLLGDEDEETVV